MRLALVFLAFLTFLSAANSSVNIAAGVKVNSQFEKKFKEFWSLYKKQDAKKMYQMEAPYFRYLYNFSQYKGYVDMIKKPKNVILSSFSEKDGLVEAEVLLEMRDGNTSLKDQWLKVGSKYYHKTQILLIFTD